MKFNIKHKATSRVVYFMYFACFIYIFIIGIVKKMFMIPVIALCLIGTLIFAYKRRLKYPSEIEIEDSLMTATYSNGEKITLSKGDVECVKNTMGRNKVQYQLTSKDRTKSIALWAEHDSYLSKVIDKLLAEKKDKL